MTHASRRIHPLPPDAISAAEALAMRQLRHQTKNALQRIIAQLERSGLRNTDSGAALADEVERRIRLSAAVSDALFGFTAAPAPMPRRLCTLAESTVALLADPEQTIEVACEVVGTCPSTLEATVLQVAHEMVGNAVKHGFHLRLVGRVELRLAARGQVLLEVRDDGWGLGCRTPGGGLPIMESLAERFGGRVTLGREQDWTVARLYLPNRG